MLLKAVVCKCGTERRVRAFGHWYREVNGDVFKECGDIAQLRERLNGIQEAVGLNPTISTLGG